MNANERQHSSGCPSCLGPHQPSLKQAHGHRLPPPPLPLGLTSRRQGWKTRSKSSPCTPCLSSHSLVALRLWSTKERSLQCCEGNDDPYQIFRAPNVHRDKPQTLTRGFPRAPEMQTCPGLVRERCFQVEKLHPSPDSLLQLLLLPLLQSSKAL